MTTSPIVMLSSAFIKTLPVLVGVDRLEKCTGQAQASGSQASIARCLLHFQVHAVCKGSKDVAEYAGERKGQPDKSQTPVGDHDALSGVPQVPSTSITHRGPLSRTTNVPQGRASCSQSTSCHDIAPPSLDSNGNLMDPVRSQQGHKAGHDTSSNLKCSLHLAGGEDEDICIICSDAPPQVVFLPCLHAVVCTTCAQRAQAATSECPSCRSKLHSVQAVTG